MLKGLRSRTPAWAGILPGHLLLPQLRADESLQECDVGGRPAVSQPFPRLDGIWFSHALISSLGCCTVLLRPWLLSCLKLRVADKEEQALGFIFLFARELSDSILQQPLELLCGLDVLFFF